jgi:sugar (pentulose or hexulose) kinase
MPDDALDGFYEKYGGQEEFSRNTASPVLGMLNSGLQILWLKKKKPEYWSEVQDILHLPQFISYLFTKAIVSGYPSIGCHTALWDFDNMEYHQWLKDEKINLPEPIGSDILYNVKIDNVNIQTGVGIHDSSASLVPYLKKFSKEKFVLVSTGTWAINMNPFSRDQLSIDELKKDCLCYLSVDKQQVKSSRLFLGHIHEVNVNFICKHHSITANVFKVTKADEGVLTKLIKENKNVIFPNGQTENYLGDEYILSNYKSPVIAYHQLMYEITKMEAQAIQLVLDKKDNVENIYITGGFVKNDIFCKLLATFLKGKKVYKAELYNATALGTAMIINKNINIEDVEINLEEIKPLNI